MSAGLQATGGVTLRRALAMGLLTLVMAGCGGSSRPSSESAGQAPAAGAESTTAAAESSAAAAAGEAGPATAAEEAAPPAQPRLAARMDPDEVRSLLARNADVLLLDVRQPEEWTPPLGHIEGATLIPLPELRARLGEIDAWRDRPVVTVCRSGNRSETARRVLLEAGFTNVANMDGGMIEWRRTE